jgi:hypothetical protein
MIYDYGIVNCQPAYARLNMGNQFPGRRNGPPDFEKSGIKVWVDHEDGRDTLFVVIRQGEPKEWRVVATNCGTDGGEFKFETKAKARKRLDK